MQNYEMEDSGYDEVDDGKDVVEVVGKKDDNDDEISRWQRW